MGACCSKDMQVEDVAHTPRRPENPHTYKIENEFEVLENTKQNEIECFEEPIGVGGKEIENKKERFDDQRMDDSTEESRVESRVSSEASTRDDKNCEKIDVYGLLTNRNMPIYTQNADKNILLNSIHTARAKVAFIDEMKDDEDERKTNFSIIVHESEKVKRDNEYVSIKEDKAIVKHRIPYRYTERAEPTYTPSSKENPIFLTARSSYGATTLRLNEDTMSPTQQLSYRNLPLPNQNTYRQYGVDSQISDNSPWERITSHDSSDVDFELWENFENEGLLNKDSKGGKQPSMLIPTLNMEVVAALRASENNFTPINIKHNDLNFSLLSAKTHTYLSQRDLTRRSLLTNGMDTNRDSNIDADIAEVVARNEEKDREVTELNANNVEEESSAGSSVHLYESKTSRDTHTANMNEQLRLLKTYRTKKNKMRPALAVCEEHKIYTESDYSTEQSCLNTERSGPTDISLVNSEIMNDDVDAAVAEKNEEVVCEDDLKEENKGGKENSGKEVKPYIKGGRTERSNYYSNKKNQNTRAIHTQRTANASPNLAEIQNSSSEFNKDASISWTTLGTDSGNYQTQQTNLSVLSTQSSCAMGDEKIKTANDEIIEVNEQVKKEEADKEITNRAYPKTARMGNKPVNNINYGQLTTRAAF